MIKAIFFDFFGVIGVWNEEVLFSNIAELYNLEKKDVSKVYYDENWLNDVEKGEKTAKDLMDYLNEKTNKKIDYGTFLKTNGGVYTEKKEFIDFIKSINQKYDCYITQNAMDHDEDWQKNTLESFNIVKKVYSSALLGARKDNPIFFEKILEENNLKPEDVLYVDDGQKYVDTAKKLGINAYVFENIEQIKRLLQ